MALTSAFGLPGLRSLELLAGSDALIGERAAATGDLAALGPITSAVETALDIGQAGSTTGSSLAGAAEAAANQVVLTTHAAIEGTGHEVPVLNTPLHALTNLGETVGLGHLGQAGTLLTDAGNLPGQVAGGGGLSAAEPVLTDAGHVATAATALVGSLEGTLVPGAGLVGPGGLVTPLVDGLDATLVSAEAAGRGISALAGPVAGATALGDAVGIGHLGETGPGGGNLLSDLVGAPGAIATGQGAGVVPALLGDLAGVAGTVPAVLGGTTGFADPAGPLLGPGGLLAPVSTLANTAVIDVHAGIENLGHEIPAINTPLHDLTNLGETIGLGHIGGGGPAGPTNLLTDVVDAPGAVLAGHGGEALFQALADAGSALHAADALVAHTLQVAEPGSLAGTLAGLGAGPGVDPLGALGDGPLAQAGDLLGTGGLLAPVASVANAAVIDVHAGIENVGHEIPALNTPLHDVTNLGETIGLGHLGGGGPAGPTNLLTDVVNAPGAVLAGDAAGALGQVAADAGPVVQAAETLVTHALGTAEPGSLAGTLAGLGAGPGGGLLGAPGGGGGGSEPIVSISAGPAGPSPVAAIDVLAPVTSGPTHTADIHLGTEPAGQPTAIGVALLGGDTISIPTFGGGGADGLVGALKDTAPAAAAATGGLHDAAPTLDLGHIVAIGFDAHAQDPHAAGHGHFGGIL